ncbi:MAG: hypothetical protein AAGA76_09290, partial [Pseudomonadota bacterium]
MKYQRGALNTLVTVMNSFFHITALAVGILLGPSIYLHFAAGDSIVSHNAIAPASILTSLACVLIFFSPNLHNRITGAYILIALFLSILAFLMVLTTLAYSGLPGSEW